MSSQYSGLPANVQSNLPTSKTINNITASTPIVVTTTTAHGLKVGDYFAIPTADDAQAIGVWKAGTVTPTTVVLLVAPGGGNSTGGIGGVSGTLVSAGFGTTYPLPDDLTDDMDAASVNVALEALGDRTAWLEYAIQYAITIKVLGTFALAGTGTITGPVTRSGSAATLAYRSATTITDTLVTANINVNSDRWVTYTPVPATGLQTLTVQNTTVVPTNGQRVRYTAYTLGINAVKLIREDASEMIESSGGTIFDAEFEYVGALSKWKLIGYSGDGTITITTP